MHVLKHDVDHGACSEHESVAFNRQFERRKAQARSPVNSTGTARTRSINSFVVPYNHQQLPRFSQPDHGHSTHEDVPAAIVGRTDSGSDSPKLRRPGAE